MRIVNYMKLIFLLSAFSLFTICPSAAQSYNPIIDMDWSADGIRLAVAYDNGQITVINSSTGQIEWSAMSGRFASIDWHPIHANQLAYVSLEQGVHIVDVSTDSIINQFSSKPYTFSIAFSPDATSIATSHSTSEIGLLTEGFLSVIDLPTGIETIAFQRVNQLITNVAWNNNGNFIGGINEGILVIWDTKTGNIVHYLSEIIEETDEVGTFLSGFIQAFAFSPNGNQIITASGIGMSFWDTDTFTKVSESPYIYGINDIDWSPDGSFIAAASGIDRSVYILDALTGNIISTIPTGIETAVVAWDSSGSKIAFAGETTASIIVLNPTITCANPVTVGNSDTLAGVLTILQLLCQDDE
jgi:WD40 repeat protein